MAGPTPRPALPEAGTLIDGRFRILGQLGEGGMGAVLEAEHVPLKRKVALKVLREKLGDDPAMRVRFEREAHALAAMQHPNIVNVVDYGVWEGMPYLVMERLEGRTLRELLDAGAPLPLDRVLRIQKQILRAIGYAHERGVVHRDLKPGNVFLQALPEDPDHVKILDFGFAKFVSVPDGPVVSVEGMAVGTPAYMAPEQVLGETIDGRTDVYAAGVILFEMIAGRRPFEGEVADMLRRRALEPAPRLSKVRPELDVSPELDDCVALALARDKVARYPDAAAFGAAIDALPALAGASAATTTPDAATEIDVSLRSIVAATAPRPPPPPPRRTPTRWWLAAALASVGLVALAIVQPWNDPAPAEEPRLHRGDAVFARATPDAGRPDAPAPDVPAPRPAPPPDPWASDVPGELAVLRDRLGDGEPSEAYLQRVAGYVRNHPAEVRGVLLLAHGYAARGWLTLALDRYTEAYALDPLSRGDPRMLSTLIHLASSPAVGPDAEQLVVDLYGREALDAVIAARAASADRNELVRFTELRDRLAALP